MYKPNGSEAKLGSSPKCSDEIIDYSLKMGLLQEKTGYNPNWIWTASFSHLEKICKMHTINI